MWFELRLVNKSVGNQNSIHEFTWFNRETPQNTNPRIPIVKMR